MNPSSQSFREWIAGEIRGILEKNASSPPFILWCDPSEEWLDLLHLVSKSSGFELWAPERGGNAEHELIIRDRFQNNERAKRVVWMPVSRENITWFKVFELEAQHIWEKSLMDSLRDYGVRIPRDHEIDLNPLLPAHAKEWLDEPKSTWKELTPESAKGALVDDHRILQVLAGEGGEFLRLQDEGKFTIFARRVTDYFGLPDPSKMDEKEWRIASTAQLLATEAANGSPQNPPSEGDRIIPPGISRDRALKLFNSWQSHIHYIPSFEELVPKADAILGLSYWARGLSGLPRSFGSRVVEETLFEKMINKLERIEEIESLASELESNLQVVKERQEGFWGSIASQKVGWNYLVLLADAASLLVENAEIEQMWKSIDEAIQWYIDKGWQLDQAGETLFSESSDMPGALQRVRARLRRGYLRTFDRINRVFSGLLSENPNGIFNLPSAGEIVLNELKESDGPLALIFLDACRLDLGYRLVHLLNEGEPVERASVQVSIAPVPSITALGMAFALPLKRKSLCIAFSKDQDRFCVKSEDFDGDLSFAEQRRNWLKEKIGAQDFLTISDVIDSDKLKKAGRGKKTLVVHGSGFDDEGHEGRLKLDGADDHLERYEKAVRRLQSIGYNQIIIATDHGFFHWQPDVDEVQEKPSGDLIWTSRRAIAGYGLTHKSAISFPLLGSELEVMVPRSINAFRTYGGLGFFHGGATLQEVIIPVIIARWPMKARKVDVVLKPVGHISSEAPRIQVQAGAKGQGKLFANANQLTRRVFVKVKDPSSGKVIFRHSDPVTIEPEGDVMTLQLKLSDPRPSMPYDTPLIVEVIDAEDEEILDREEIKLKVDIDEW